MQVSGDLVDWLEPTGSSLTAASVLDDTLIARICGALPTESFVTLSRFGSLKNRVLYPKQRLRGWKREATEDPRPSLHSPLGKVSCDVLTNGH